MPTSATSVCNAALNRLGAAAIASLTEDSDAARSCTTQYPIVRDALLRAHDWNFSVTRMALTHTDAAPASEYDYQYPLPADCVYVEDTDIPGDEDVGVPATGSSLGWGERRASWRIEQSPDGHRVLVTSERTVVIRYVRAADPGVWDALFVEALTEHLAAALAVPVTGKESLLRLHTQLADGLMQRAMSRNVHETGTQYAQANTRLTRVRNSQRARIPGITVGS